MVSGSCQGHRHQCGLVLQHRSWTSTRPLAAVWTRDTNMASGGSMDLGNLSRRLNPENKQCIVLDTLLLLRVKMIVWLGSISRACTSSRRLYWYPGMTIMFAAHNPCCDSLLSSSQQGEQRKQQWWWHLHAFSQVFWQSGGTSLVQQWREASPAVVARA